VPRPSRHPRRGPSLEPTNSLQPGLQAGRQAPELTISFTSPNTHPKTATPGDPPKATVATAHTVTGTPSKRYKPKWWIKADLRPANEAGIPMISNRQAVAMAAVMGEGLKPLTIR
jgi:hypothetical protein